MTAVRQGPLFSFRLLSGFKCGTQTVAGRPCLSHRGTRHR